MKARFVLAISVLLNVGLLAALVATRRPTEVDLATESTGTDAVPVTAVPVRSPEQERSDGATTFVKTNRLDWSSVESEDYRDYIANLRAIGVPEETVRDIIIADVNKLFARRVAALYPSAKDYQFWRVEDRNARTDERKREQQRRQLDKEKRALIHELLGIDYESEMARWSGRPDDDDWRYGFLTPEKQQQVQALQDKYREQERALWSDGGGRNPENRAKLAALRTQRETELAQLLGPQDYEQYQLRNSATARTMRDNLITFQPTEEEFRKIFEVRKAFEDQYTFTRGGGDETARQQRRQAEQQVEDQIKATLGEHRYRDYQLSQDERYRDLSEFGQRSNLPRETVDTVYEMRRAAEDALRKVRGDLSLAPDVKQATLAALTEETRRSVSQALGEQAWKDYQRRDGRWIEQLAPSTGGRNPSGRNGDGGDRGNRGGAVQQ